MNEGSNLDKIYADAAADRGLTVELYLHFMEKAEEMIEKLYSKQKIDTMSYIKGAEAIRKLYGDDFWHDNLKKFRQLLDNWMKGDGSPSSAVAAAKEYDKVLDKYL